MACIRYFAIASIALLAAPGSARETSRDKLSAAVHREMAEQGPIMTDADHALIARKCGQHVDETKNSGVRIDDTLHCANGKRVAMDDELRAMTRRISTRAQRHADRAMKSAAVAQAQAQVAEEAAARAMEQARRHLRQR